MFSGLGCVAPKKVERKSIDQLYREAIKESIDRPPVIQPASPFPALIGQHTQSPNQHIVASNQIPFTPIAPTVAQASWQVIDAGDDPLDQRISEIFEQTDIQKRFPF